MPNSNLNSDSKSEAKLGLIYALVAYVSWGFFPLYWHMLNDLSAIEILCHRMLWSFLLYFGMTIWMKRYSELLKYFKDVAYWRWTVVSAIAITCNWGLYIYAVNSGQVVEASLGYFLNPLLNIAMGVVLLKETMSTSQKISCAFAFAGVLALTLLSGKTPWISLCLAVTFSTYGFVRKKANAHAIVHSTLETLMLVPIGLFGVIYFRSHAALVFTANHWLLLIGGGFLTGLVLYSFSEGAKRLPLSYLGFLQFASPTLQFLTGVVIFHEEITAVKWGSFILIWIGVAIFAGTSIFRAFQKT